MGSREVSGEPHLVQPQDGVQGKLSGNIVEDGGLGGEPHHALER